MLKNYGLLLIIIALSHQVAMAQFSDIRGKVTDGKEPLATTMVTLKKGGVKVKSVFVSSLGDYIFSDLTSGKYTVEAYAIGYHLDSTLLTLSSGQSFYHAVVLIPSTEVLDDIVKRVIRLVDVPPGTTGDAVVEGPYDDPLKIIKNNPFVTERNGVIQGAGTRVGQMQIIKGRTIQIGPPPPSTLGLGSVRVVSVGVPAMYGDFIGGAIEYTDKDILDTVSIRKYVVRSSSPFNAYHQNALETFWYKPLIVNDGQTKLAISHSLFADFKKDPNPSSIQLYELSENSKQGLLSTPMISTRSGGELPFPVTFTSEDFNKVKSKQNVSSSSFYSSLKLEWKPSEDLIIRVDPSFQYRKQHRFSFSNSLLNAEHNPLNISMTGKLNAQLQHTLKRPYNSKGVLTYDSSLISKINYILIADYQRFNSQTKDPIHLDNIFEYGHVGKFETKGEDVYTYVENTRVVKGQNGEDIVVGGYYEFDEHRDTSLSFDPNSKNGQRAAITQYALDNNQVNSLDQLSESLGLRNGMNPTAINGMWYAPGTVVSNYGKSDVQKTSFNAIMNLSVNPTKELNNQHDVQIGTLFEQRRRSYYSLSANSLWQLMPQLLNSQYSGLDIKNPILSYDANGVFLDTIRYNYKEELDRQSTFDRSLREIVGDDNGYTSGGARFLDIQSVDPSKLSIDMFSADELWNNGNSYVQYAGYDHTGKRIKQAKGVNDFLNNKAKRFVNAYNPNYTALWIQDKFVLEKIKIRAGVRIERFDANQLVLKDQYSLYPVKTINEVSEIAGQATSHPDHMSNDAVVYVDNMKNPTKIVGYRKGSTWYTENGSELSSPEYLRAQTDGVIQPLLVDPDNQKLGAASFKDFQPEIIVLPRLSFSFPLNSSALFYAYYDKFAQRPNFAQSFAPISSYYYLANASSTLLANPALKPAKRTDYQLGFKQILGLHGVLNLRAGYSEIKDDINLVNIEQAYPRSYLTYGNIDFSTIKSFGGDYELSLDNMSLKVNYLLQFADGTGSNANSAAALVQAGQPNLKSLFPLEYDVRHKFNVSMSFKLDPIAGGSMPIFRNMRVNLFANTQSGTPYTALVKAVPEAQSLGTVSRSQIKGNPFGSRLPWNYALDLSVSKVVMIKRKPVVLQLNALNLLNVANIYNVYAYSSSATDDGYLLSPEGQQNIKRELSAQSFVNYYNLKQNNPNNFGAPRVVSLTIRSSF